MENELPKVFRSLFPSHLHRFTCDRSSTEQFTARVSTTTQLCSKYANRFNDVTKTPKTRCQCKREIWEINFVIWFWASEKNYNEHNSLYWTQISMNQRKIISAILRYRKFIVQIDVNSLAVTRPITHVQHETVRSRWTKRVAHRIAAHITKNVPACYPLKYSHTRARSV